MTGGPQGSGVDSSANIFAGACALSGLWTFGSREYYSSIKGPHSYFEVRANSERIRSQVNNVNLLATFDAETLIRHADEVCPGGGIIYDPTFSAIEIDKVDTIEQPVVARVKDRLAKQGLPGTVAGILEEAKKRNVNLYPIPYNDIVAKTAAQIGEHQLSKVSRIVNVLSVAASFAILGFDLNYLNQSIARTFGSKKKVIDMNEIGAKMAYDIAKGLPKQSFSYQLKPIQNQPRLLLMGNEAVALGKIVGGCRVQTYYPITPAADESEFIESHENFDLVDGGQPGKKGSVLVTQTEDEIAAITMAIGAALAGARAATSTSGPGFSLMVEGLGWAGMNEVPVVITQYSRGGPSTGQPTRHEQGDLKFVLSASHGEFPRIVLCSGHRFWNSGDEHDEMGHIEEDPFNRISMMDKRMTKLETAAREIPEMEKFNFFPSTRKQADATLVSWGSTKGPILDAMKLLEKDGISVEFLQIRLANPFPTESVREKLSKAKLPIDIEQNYSAQMAQVIAEKTMMDIKNKIVKYNGRPMTQDEIYESVKRIISNPTQNKRVVLTHGA